MLTLGDRHKDMSFVCQHSSSIMKCLQHCATIMSDSACTLVRKNHGSTCQIQILDLRVLTFSLLFLSAQAFAAPSSLCENNLTWTMGTHVWISLPNTQESVSIQRYENGAWIDINERGQQKSLIMLNTGEYIFRGAASGAQEFLSADLAVSAPIVYLKKIYATPCDASRASEFNIRLDQRDLSAGGVQSVTGTIEARDSALNYALEMHSNVASSPKQIVQGGWSAKPMTPIPPDTVITGWSLTRSVGGPVQIIEDKNIKELYESQKRTKQ